MFKTARRLGGIFAAIALLFVVGHARAQSYEPAIVYESILNGVTIHESGEVAIGNFDLAFAPEGQVNAMAAIVDEKGQVIGSVPFAEIYKRRDGVFGRITASAHQPIVLTEAGLYAAVFVVDGKPVTRFPFVMRAGAKSDDPFASSGQKLFGDGRWRQLAHITAGKYKNEAIVQLTMWLGAPDLASPDTHFEPILVKLIRDGETIAHTKHGTNGFGNVFFERKQMPLFKPHSEKESPNAVMLPMDELKTGGAYEVLVQRVADDTLIRHFKFTVSGGKIVPLPQTKLDYEQPLDMIVPRVRDGGGDFVEAVWIASQ